MDELRPWLRKDRSEQNSTRAYEGDLESEIRLEGFQRKTAYAFLFSNWEAGLSISFSGL